jgi:hypothetical protein
MTVRHIVMWNVLGKRGSVEHRARLLTLKRAFEGLLGQIPGLITIEIGIDSSGVEYACDAVLLSEFDSQDALQAYAVHPAHMAVKRQVADMRIARYQVDYPAGRTAGATASDPRITN